VRQEAVILILNTILADIWKKMSGKNHFTLFTDQNRTEGMKKPVQNFFQKKSPGKIISPSLQIRAGQNRDFRLNLRH